jgi:protein-L-isoaspartate(D-aspartate) O-methyltransferase
MGSGCGQKTVPPSDFAAQRQRMVQTQLVGRGIHDQRVLAAMGKVPREELVPPDMRGQSYHDSPLPIGYEQTISQPYMVARMTQELRLQPRDRVLEIGTGSGYQTAVLAEVTAETYSIEIVEPLAKKAEATLQRLGYKNVRVKVGDGYQGWPEEAPFDAIIVTCAPDHVPQPLIDQLGNGGRMIIPVGPRYAQQLYLFDKINGVLRERVVETVRFVPMRRSAERR